jgi:hypothetical protein
MLCVSAELRWVVVDVSQYDPAVGEGRRDRIIDRQEM